MDKCNKSTCTCTLNNVIQVRDNNSVFILNDKNTNILHFQNNRVFRLTSLYLITTMPFYHIHS